MEAAIPQGMALREMLRRNESEGHSYRLRPLLLPQEEALPEPKNDLGFSTHRQFVII
jgi:hypothetical protein